VDLRQEIQNARRGAQRRWCRAVFEPHPGVGRAELLHHLGRFLGFAVAGEGFADRAYEPDGSLRSRRLPGALITDPAEAAAQALRLARDGRVDTICVHSDTPGAARILAEVRRVLAGEGFLLRSLRG
jgi:lactam utilization protein B